MRRTGAAAAGGAVRFLRRSARVGCSTTICSRSRLTEIDMKRTPLPGEFDGETVTRRRLMTGTAHIAGAVAVSAVALPVIGFAAGPGFERQPVMWQPVGPATDFR